MKEIKVAFKKLFGSTNRSGDWISSRFEKTFGTNLGIAGATDAERMKLTRLKSYRLMTENYNDSEKVPASELVAKLPEFVCLENGNHTLKNTLKN